MLFAFERAALSVLLLVSIQAACSVALTLVVLTRVWRINSPTTPSQFKLRYVVKKGWLFVAAEGLSNIYTQSGPAILGAAVGTAAVGIYSPARNLILLTLLAPNLLFSVGLPLLIAPDTPPSEYWRVICVMLSGSVAYGLVALAGLWIFGSLLIRIVYGSEFDAALPLVRVMSLVPLLKACSFVWVAIMLSRLQQRLRVTLQLLTVVVSVVAGLLIIPAYGLAGAAWLYVRGRIAALRVVRPGAWFVTSSGKPLKLLLINNHSLLNAGDYAIFTETLRMLEARFPEAQIDLVFNDTASARAALPGYAIHDAPLTWAAPLDQRGQYMFVNRWLRLLYLALLALAALGYRVSGHLPPLFADRRSTTCCGPSPPPIWCWPAAAATSTPRPWRWSLGLVRLYAERLRAGAADG